MSVSKRGKARVKTEQDGKKRGKQGTAEFTSKRTNDDIEGDREEVIANLSWQKKVGEKTFE